VLIACLCPLIAVHTQMAQQPEASSTLFMSQFTDDAVRDAIARVSLEFVLSFKPRCKYSALCKMNGDFILSDRNCMFLWKFVWNLSFFL
jgi:hypothetical protein